MYVHFPHIHQEKHAIFDKSERKLVNALDEMRSLWQEFVRRKAADTTVSMATNNNSTVYIYTFVLTNIATIAVVKVHWTLPQYSGVRLLYITQA